MIRFNPENTENVLVTFISRQYYILDIIKISMLIIQEHVSSFSTSSEPFTSVMLVVYLVTVPPVYTVLCNFVGWVIHRGHRWVLYGFMVRVSEHKLWDRMVRHLSYLRRSLCERRQVGGLP
jgi:hypothetical protein